MVGGGGDCSGGDESAAEGKGCEVSVGRGRYSRIG